VSPEAAAKNAELKKTFEEGVAASRAGNHDDAIAKFQHAAELNASCYDCYYNIAYSQTQKKDLEKAEAAYKKAIELKADYGEAYSGLANIYNMQRKFDEAAAASAKAMELSGGGTAAAGGNPDALFNQGVILWNAGKIADAKKQFEATIAAEAGSRRSALSAGHGAGQRGQPRRGRSGVRKVRAAGAERTERGNRQGDPRHHQEVIDSSALRTRLDDVRARIARAAGRVGRDPASIRLIAVSKTFPVDCVRAAADLGHVDFGENKVQEALPKMDQTSDLPLRWHLVGHLQSNKAKKAGRFDMIHSVDSAALVSRLDEAARAANKTVELLVQVDLAGEATKHGAQEDEVAAVFDASPLADRRCGRSA
jgi:Flp pilus assembly protein TadD